MYLKKPPWADPQVSSEELAPSVGEMAESLNKKRVYSEVSFALRSGLREARTEFSFVRLHGIRSLIKFLRFVSQSPSTIDLFCQAQSLPDLQVVPVIFQNTLLPRDDVGIPNLKHIFTAEPIKLNSPATCTEVVLALRLLEGCCLLHRGSSDLAHEHGGVKVIMNILSTRGVHEQAACLDVLMSLLLDSSINQMDFEACGGIEEVTRIMKDEQVDENLRIKCADFLLLLIGHVNVGRGSTMESLRDDLRSLLGDRSPPLV